jgi:tetraacyldisaccharide 4'-kinase
VSAVSAIGDPSAFESQLRASGAILRGVRRFPDHHTFSNTEAEQIASAAKGTSGVVCTLKDAVKLAKCWPRQAPPLWYLSQSVVVDHGAEALDRAFARVLAARAAIAPTAG